MSVVLKWKVGQTERRRQFSACERHVYYNPRTHVTLQRVRESLKYKLGQSLSKSLMPQNDTVMFSQMWIGPETFTGDTEVERNVLISLVNLVCQIEYALFMLLKNQRYTPKVIGTCGYIYAAEHTPVVQTLSPKWWYTETLVTTQRWPEIAAAALEVLDLF